MNLGVYTNGFEVGEKVVIDIPGTVFHGMETQVVKPGPADLMEPEDVLVRNPVAPGWVLRLPDSCLLKDWTRQAPRGGGAAEACAV